MVAKIIQFPVKEKPEAWKTFQRWYQARFRLYCKDEKLASELARMNASQYATTKMSYNSSGQVERAEEGIAKLLSTIY